jgi:hypothetical protein
VTLGCRGGWDPGCNRYNMDEIYNEIYVEERVNEWKMSIPFIKWGMKYSCAQFADNMSISYEDDLFHKTT